MPFGIKTRVAAGYILAIALFVIAGALSNAALFRSHDLFGDYRGLTLVSSEITQAQAAFTGAQSAGQAFILSLDPAKLDEALDDTAQAAAALSAAKRNTTDAEIRTEVASADPLLELFRTAVQTLQTNGLQGDTSGKLDRASADAAALLEQIHRGLDLRTVRVGPEVDKEMRSGIRLTTTILAAAILLAAASSFVIGRSISIPIRQLTAATLSVAGDQVVPFKLDVTRRDELGDMARVLSTFRDNALQVKALERERAARDQDIARERRDGLAVLASRFEHSVKGLVAYVAASSNDMKAASQNLSESVDRARHTTSLIADQAAEAAAQVASVATAAEALFGSVEGITQRSDMCMQLAREGDVRARETTQTVSALSNATARIDEVVGLIRAIADKTNLLSLNAAIEAARAGNSGNGFAVVAAEVRSLANATAQATENIAHQIAAVRGAAADAVATIEAISRSISQFSTSIVSISDAGENQRATLVDVAQAAVRVTESAKSVSANIISIERGMNASASAAAATLTAADALGERAQSLTKEVDDFLAYIRSS